MVVDNTRHLAMNASGKVNYFSHLLATLLHIYYSCCILSPCLQVGVPPLPLGPSPPLPLWVACGFYRWVQAQMGQGWACPMQVVRTMVLFERTGRILLCLPLGQKGYFWQWYVDGSCGYFVYQSSERAWIQFRGTHTHTHIHTHTHTKAKEGERETPIPFAESPSVQPASQPARTHCASFAAGERQGGLFISKQDIYLDDTYHFTFCHVGVWVCCCCVRG
ncbi:MAG: hypothetical protein J3Q66DRAFT_344505 [Benniella sp.]|nr:MAG: hypothetical protein J3Q66DRAFT_344505 [Benniella sp.]